MVLSVSRTCTFSPRSVGTQEKFKNKTSNQKAKEDYEKIKAERARKEEVNLKQSSYLMLNKIQINTIPTSLSSI